MKLTLIFILSCSLSSFANEKKALKAIKRFGNLLQAELKKGLKESPTQALEICNLKAPQIQEEVLKKGIELGRVSKKNRNPHNRPKKWMAPYIESFHNNKIKKPYVVVKLDKGKHGLLKPIRTMPVCLTCHGEKIPDDLQGKIKTLYPNDLATGYKLGQIRGFFWAEY